MKETKKQIEIAERLQMLWLEKMEARMKDGTATSTDFATLSKFLRDNGWTVDETKLPASLRDLLQESLPDPKEEPDGQETQIAGYIGQR